MTIHHFAGGQNDVFVPALLALLAAIVLLCLPIVFRLPLERSGRRVPVLVVVGVLAVVALGVTVQQAAVGFGALGAERARVRAELASRYGVDLDAGQVGELVDGGRPLLVLPQQAEAAGLRDPQAEHTLRLVPERAGGDRYELRIGNRPVPPVG